MCTFLHVHIYKAKEACDEGNKEFKDSVTDARSKIGFSHRRAL